MKDKKFCPTCGSSTVEYVHGLNKNLIVGLLALAKIGGKANLKILGLTRNQWDNFQKLRYWGIVGQSFSEDLAREKGVWFITELGWKFICSQASVHKKVWTYRGTFIRFEGDVIYIYDIDESYYWQREDYLEMRKAHVC